MQSRLNKRNRNAVKSSAKLSPKQRRILQTESFYSEVDSGKYNEFIQEESFNDLLRTIRDKAQFISSAIKVRGKDEVNFKILFPFPQFCAWISQCQFDRVQDFKLRYQYCRVVADHS